MPNLVVSHNRAFLPQPYPPKEQYDHRKEPHPDLPTNARLLGHAQHASHSPLDLIPRVLKLIVHLLCQGGRIADLVANKVCQLRMSISNHKTPCMSTGEKTHILQHLDLTRQHSHMLIVLALQLIQHS